MNQEELKVTDAGFSLIAKKIFLSSSRGIFRSNSGNASPDISMHSPIGVKVLHRCLYTLTNQ